MPQPRRFDHAEAARLRAAGWTYPDLARRFGVTESAVVQAVKRLTDPAWAANLRERHRLYQRRTRKVGKCIRCGKPGVWLGYGRPGFCQSCANVWTVEADTLLCTRCWRWFPDEAFPRSRTNPARRFRHAYCRACSTQARREHRQRIRVPCVDCGELCSPPGTNNRRTPADRPPRCQACANRYAHLHGSR